MRHREAALEQFWEIAADSGVNSGKVASPDAADPMLRHALGRVPERDDRVLRVVYNDSVNPWWVVTACFDRAMRGKL